MDKLIDLISAEVSAAFQEAGFDPAYGKVAVSNRPDLGEYQCNGAMPAAKAAPAASRSAARAANPTSVANTKASARFTSRRPLPKATAPFPVSVPMCMIQSRPYMCGGLSIFGNPPGPQGGFRSKCTENPPNSA